MRGCDVVLRGGAQDFLRWYAAPWELGNTSAASRLCLPTLLVELGLEACSLCK